MKKFNLYFVIIIALLIGACSTGLNLNKTIQDGETAYGTGDYQKALETYEIVISDYKNKGKENECPVYYEAANAAAQLGMTEKAISYLEKNRYTAKVNGDTYFELSQLYRQIDNLSKELDALETYLEKYPDGNKTGQGHERLFEIYVEIENWDMVLEEWKNISQAAKNDSKNVEGYFLANKAMEYDSVCDRLATGLLSIDEHNLLALDWTAKNYFWQAENRYKHEMEAYEKNKTNKQYNKLLKALDQVTADFKTALDYFKRLYKLDPTSKNAKYLGDIYNRLDDKEKADYYYGKAEG